MLRYRCAGCKRVRELNDQNEWSPWRYDYKHRSHERSVQCQACLVMSLRSTSKPANTAGAGVTVTRVRGRVGSLRHS